MDSFSPHPHESGLDHRATVRKLILLILGFCLLGLCTISPHAVRSAVHRMESLVGRHCGAAPASPAPSTAGN